MEELFVLNILSSIK